MKLQVTWPLAALLHLANAATPIVGRDEFYALKDRLLWRFAERDDDDVQHIVDRCWGPWPHEKCPGGRCPKCGGTGIHYERWIRLERYTWCGYMFHRPAESLYWRPSSPVTIEGRIEHRRVGRRGNEARLWLYLLTGEWRLLGTSLRASKCHGRYAWPMLTLQRIVMPVFERLKRRNCAECGRRFWTLGHGWLICPDCRRGPDAVIENELDEVPF